MGNTVPWYSTILLGFGTVFVGLICLIFITMLMSVILRAISSKKAAEQPTAVPAPAQETIPDRGAFAAAVAASIATVMGTDVSGLRILSIKKL